MTPRDGAQAPKTPAAGSDKPGPTTRSALAAGADRASGERRRRTGTPLLSTDPVDVSAARRAKRATAPDAPAEPVTRTVAPSATNGDAKSDAAARPHTDDAPSAEPRKRPTRGAIRAARGSRAASSSTSSEQVKPTLRAVPSPSDSHPGHVGKPAGHDEPAQRHTSTAHDATGAAVNSAARLRERASSIVDAALEGAEFSSQARPSPAEFVELAVNVLRTAAAAAGVPAEDVEARVAETLAYVRRRLAGDFTVDEFGFDEDYTLNVHLPLLRPLYRHWFRVEVKGIENIPAEGGALLVANHSGTVALDSLMTQVAVHDEHPAHRHLRMLGADLVFQTPFVGTMARRSGSTLAANTDAERLLNDGHLVGVWPEGFKGVGKPYSERYKLQRFGRGGFVSAALRTGVPIVPCSIVGAEEIYPIIGNMPTVARLLGLPYAPITPTFPLLGPLGLIPLPSKWLIEFGPPIDTSSFGPDAADDPMLVFDLTDQVRETIQQTLYSLLMQRTSVFL